MQPQGRGLRRILKKGCELGFSGLEIRHLCLHQWVIHADLDSREDSGDLLLDLLQFTSGLILRVAPIACRGIERQTIFLDEGCDQIGVQQFPLQTVENPGLHLLA